MIRAAVLGKPIAHSLSPTLHRAAYQRLGIEGEYTSFEVGEDELSPFIQSHTEGWSGFSLTMPLKEAVLEIATSIDPIAHRIRSANTLIRRGRDWYATSTDRSGFLSLLASHKLLGAHRVLIFGAGGTARAAASALDDDGREIVIVRRSQDRDSAARGSVERAALELKSWQPVDLSHFDLVINTVPGNASHELALNLEGAPALIDVLYHPWPTELAKRWVDHNQFVVSGIELLIWQGIDQITLMTGEEFDREEMFNYLFHTLVTFE